MKIIEIAREQMDVLNEGIAFVALWQERQPNGRMSWFSQEFFPTEVNDTDPTFEAEDLERLSEIFALDENAVLLNGFYHSWIGSADEPLNAMSISKGLAKHYEIKNSLLADYLAGDGECEGEDDGNVAEGDSEEVGTITIEFPFRGSEEKQENFRRLIAGKATLITAALGEDGTGDLPIEFTEDGTVKCDWLQRECDSEVLKAWCAFLTAAAKFAIKAQRINVTDEGLSDNPKFDFRVFCVRLGMSGSDLKDERRTLLQNLEGDSAFKNAETRERWYAKHTKTGA